VQKISYVRYVSKVKTFEWWKVTLKVVTENSHICINSINWALWFLEASNILRENFELLTHSVEIKCLQLKNKHELYINKIAKKKLRLTDNLLRIVLNCIKNKIIDMHREKSTRFVISLCWSSTLVKDVASKKLIVSYNGLTTIRTQFLDQTLGKWSCRK
jgi:hypothetical protein